MYEKQKNCIKKELMFITQKFLDIVWTAETKQK